MKGWLILESIQGEIEGADIDAIATPTVQSTQFAPDKYPI